MGDDDDDDIELSFFQRSCDFYLRLWRQQGYENRKEIGRRCRAKYPRGINIVEVKQSDIDNELFTPHIMVPHKFDRIFLNYERLLTDAFTTPFPEDTAKCCKELIDTYDPNKTVLWLFVLTGSKENGGQFQVFTSAIE